MNANYLPASISYQWQRFGRPTLQQIKQRYPTESTFEALASALNDNMVSQQQHNLIKNVVEQFGENI